MQRNLNTNSSMAKRRRQAKHKPSAAVAMTKRTQDFLQKFCFRERASVDMTQYGFICDSKVLHVNLLLKPLKHKIGEICDTKPRKKHGCIEHPNGKPTSCEVPRPIVKCAGSDDPTPTLANQVNHKKACKVKFKLNKKK